MNALQIFEPDPEVLYGIEAAAHLAHIPKRTILVYCKHGLVSPVTATAQEGYLFDREAIVALLRIEALRKSCGGELAAIKVILDLMNEVQSLRRELRSALQRGHSARWKRRGRGRAVFPGPRE
jgi:DNA-binding transcriptional MerR regulator